MNSENPEVEKAPYHSSRGPVTSGLAKGQKNQSSGMLDRSQMSTNDVSGMRSITLNKVETGSVSQKDSILVSRRDHITAMTSNERK